MRRRNNKARGTLAGLIRIPLDDAILPVFCPTTQTIDLE
jgi:hypothetical protein